ncbi:hypothetical protein D1227_08955 [Henriciella mobilis]|uniref:Uncharacterized protein n=1 Tax=Henriciella mobilis TaxID=2305467 RepID=A0A399R946_9PROT|nr:hypothetical protein D1231_17930 [Henriciella mobilis]RIJ22030.1 hypothetical protein D1227_08955 [Henriciella mobilis]RIJ26447.1 hypothetical protein D1223_15815 [Henriciella mobilis]
MGQHQRVCFSGGRCDLADHQSGFEHGLDESLPNLGVIADIFDQPRVAKTGGYPTDGGLRLIVNSAQCQRVRGLGNVCDGAGSAFRRRRAP